VQVVFERDAQHVPRKLGGVRRVGWVLVVGNAVEFCNQLWVMQTSVQAHEIGRRPRLGEAPNRGQLRVHEVDGLVADVAPKIELQGINAAIPRIDLLKARESVAPECRPPGVVQRVKCSVTLAEPGAEACQAKLTEALAAILIGEVPHGERRMFRIALC